MPSTIPYSPNVELTDVVHSDVLKAIKDMAMIQSAVDARQDELNALIATRLNLEMTLTEFSSLITSASDINVVKKELDILNSMITNTAKDYIVAKIDAEQKLLPLRSGLAIVGSDVESPVDYVKSQFKTLPLGADSINMDVQYFDYDKNSQSGQAFANTVAGYVSASLDFLNGSAQAQATNSARSQVSKQVSNHDILGTLVISVACTHKNALVMAPCALNVDKAIKCWNQLVPDRPLDPTDEAEMAAAIQEKDDANAKSFSILTGTTFGSSFIGMVHIINNSDTQASQRLASFAASAQAQMEVGAWFSKVSGGFGVSDSFSSNVKDLLSSQSINNHVTLICMGLIPSIVACDVQLGVEKFAKFDPESSMAEVAAIQNATAGDQNSVSEAASNARQGQEMISLKAAQIKATMSSLASYNDGKNKVIDINSMMTALDDYLRQAREDKGCGVPINYYTKEITRKMLAEMWVGKYFPGKYTQIKYEDGSDGPAPASGGNSGGSGNSGSGDGGDSGGNSGGDGGDSGGNNGGDGGGDNGGGDNGGGSGDGGGNDGGSGDNGGDNGGGDGGGGDGSK